MDGLVESPSSSLKLLVLPDSMLITPTQSVPSQKPDGTHGRELSGRAHLLEQIATAAIFARLFLPFFSPINCTRAHFIVGELGRAESPFLLRGNKRFDSSQSSLPLSCAQEHSILLTPIMEAREGVFSPEDRCLLPPVVTFIGKRFFDAVFWWCRFAAGEKGGLALYARCFANVTGTDNVTDGCRRR